jgi:hypothetical protein
MCLNCHFVVFGIVKLETRVLRSEKISVGQEYCIMMSFMICALHQILLG